MITIPTAPWAHYVFDLLGWLSAALAGRWVFRHYRPQVERLAQQTEPSYFVCLGLGGAFGAWFFGSLNTLQSPTPTLSHSIAGALTGAIIAVELWKWRAGVAESTGTPFVVPICTGIIVGRLGCFFAGLADGTYGTPSSLPWAVDIGDGIARHPVQLYESAAMLAFLLFFLNALRRGSEWPWVWGFHAMIIAYAVQRFCWEFLKPYPQVAGPFNIFHFLMLGMMFYGFVWIARGRRSST
jgi:phosphatidylglycerol---prolipoprotein diacylglyceryl transferase